ncbi:UrcA family protein [Sphingorhabdus sp. Alg239-R122]|uniref:UrcA family protein n=1 Tax=Sphingorhabdus sp. Alg239-R122 TaxID=2305989 RepID=UPI0013DA7779|nr:UrcA family protein [Sphingorhabdus sp. Alg239-R122]
MFKKTAFTIAAACMAVSPAMVAAQTNDTVSVTVQTNDLDLANAKDRSRLDFRIKSAARKICGENASRSIAASKIHKECIAQVVSNAQPTVELAVSKAATRVALNSYATRPANG